MNDIAKRIFELARPFGPCRMFKGNESDVDLLRLFLSPQGLEFCTKYDFLKAEHFADFPAGLLAKWGIYADTGNVAFINEETVVLVGRCSAMLEYDSLDYVCQVVLLGGARATIKARGWSVVRVHKAAGCECEVDRQDNAVVIC